VRMKWWLLDPTDPTAMKLMYVGDFQSDCKRAWLRHGRARGWTLVEMPAGDEEGLKIGNSVSG
jgi:hypothetical protein